MELFAFFLQAILILASVTLVVVILVGLVVTAEQSWYEIVTFVNKYRFGLVAVFLSCYQVALFVWEERHDFSQRVSYS